MLHHYQKRIRFRISAHYTIDMPSREWERFMDNFFGDPYMMWHDGIDPTSAAALKGEERDKAEEMLIQSMQEGDYWAPMGLREMRSKKAIPIMKSLLSTAHCRQHIEISHALLVLEDDLSYVDHLIHDLHNCGSEFDRLVVAMRFRDFNMSEIREKVISALFHALENDPSYLVRIHSSDSLIYLHGLKQSSSEYREIFKHIVFGYKPEEKADIETALEHYRTAARLLRELFAKKS